MTNPIDNSSGNSAPVVGDTNSDVAYMQQLLNQHNASAAIQFFLMQICPDMQTDQGSSIETLSQQENYMAKVLQDIDSMKNSFNQAKTENSQAGDDDFNQKVAAVINDLTPPGSPNPIPAGLNLSSLLTAAQDVQTQVAAAGGASKIWNGDNAWNVSPVQRWIDSITGKGSATDSSALQNVLNDLDTLSSGSSSQSSNIQQQVQYTTNEYTQTTNMMTTMFQTMSDLTKNIISRSNSS